MANKKIAISHPRLNEGTLPIPNEDVGRMNKDEIWISKEALFKGVSTRFGYEPLRSMSKIWISSFVHPSKIFVWGA